MVLYYGNQVSYGSSGAKWRVELEVWDSGATKNSTVTVYYRYRIYSTGSISDSSNTVSWTTPWNSGSKSVSLNIPFNGGTVYLSSNPASATAMISYASQRGLAFKISMNGIAGGGTGPSTINITYYLPKRSPIAPTSPGTSVDTITGTSARIVVTASASNGGVGIERYDAYVMSNNVMPGSGGKVVASATGGTFIATGLIPGTTYYYTAQAKNAAGLWSPLTPIKSFTTLPAALVNVNGVWENALAYVNVNGDWLYAIPYVNVNGTWLLA